MKRLLASLAVVACAAAAADATAAKPTSCSATFGMMAPLSGPGAVVGREIVNWTRLSVANWNARHGTHFSLVEGDTELNPAQAAIVAQQFISNARIIGTVGPGASQEVAAVGQTMDRAHIAMVSPSATATNLTVGARFHDFFRVVARDDQQGPTAARYIIGHLHPKRVMIVDDQSSFSTGLAASAAPVLQEAGVTVDRESVPQAANDFASLAAKTSSYDLVFLTWQLPANIKLFVQQLHAQGRTVPTFATTFDGATDYVSSFSVNSHEYPPDAAISRQYEKRYGTNYTGQFGAPSYVAAQVLMSAAGALCAQHEALTRGAMLAAVRKVRLPSSIIGRPISFDRRGDLVGGRFYIYKLVGEGYKLVA
jgi:branched-chain amino acid transport system substrate-binding protein